MYTTGLLYAINSIVFGSLIVFLIIKSPFSVNKLVSTGKYSIVCLTCILLIGAYLRFTAVPHNFQTFYEEYESYNSARMISDHGEFSMCAEGTLEKCEASQPIVFPSGAPFLAAMVMKISNNRTPEAVFTTNSILGTVIILLTFFVALFAFENVRGALFASFLAACHPLAVILSTSGGMEITGLFFITLLFFFYSIYLKEKNTISSLGMIFSSIACFLVAPEYAFVPVFSSLLFIFFRKGGSVRFVFSLVSLLSLVLLKHLPPIYENAFSFNGNNAIHLFKINLIMFSKSPYYMFAFVASGILGCVLSFRKSTSFVSIAFFTIIHIFIMGLYGKDFTNGDFIRYSLPSIIYFSVYGGLGLTWLLNFIKSDFLKNLAVSFAVIFILSSSFQLSQLRLSDYMMEQDQFLKNNLGKINSNCAIFSLNTSLVMTYTNARAYELKTLGEKAKNEVCVMMVSDAFCAGPNKNECDDITSGFSREAFQSEDIFGYYTASIFRLVPTSNIPDADNIENN